jgi:hypothetical protein
MNANSTFRRLQAFGLFAVLLLSAPRAQAYPEPECVYYPPTWSVNVYPQMTEAWFAGIPEPGLTNESIVAPGWLSGHDGTLLETMLSDNCPTLTETIPWPQTGFIGWASYFPSSVSPISGLAGNFFTNESGPFYVTFIPRQPGDEKLVVTIEGIASVYFVNYAYPPIDPINLPISVFPRQRLAYLSFNNFTLEGNLGQLPVVENNISRAATPFGKGINFDSPSSIELKYPAYQNDAFSVSEPDGSTVFSSGSPNVRLNEGTVRFWYSPNWSSGSGPSNAVLFQMLGSGSYLYRNIQITTNGTVIKVDSVPFPIHLTANQWYQIAVTYSSTSTAVYTNGVEAGSLGGGVGGSPIVVLTNFRVGSDGGSGQARGVLDEIETFNYAMPASEVLAGYQSACAIDTDGDGIPDLQDFQAGIDLSDPPGGNPISTPPPSPTPGDTTPPVIHLLEPINVQ